MKKFKYLTVLLAILLMLVSCGGNTTTPTNNNNTSEEKELVLRRAYYNPHGTRSFARIVVALVDDKIVAANIDEYQTGADGMEFVPSSDGAFGEGLKDVKLYSKRVNQEAYSKNMTEKAQATKTLLEGYQAIEAFVVGKTADEVAAVEGEAGTPVDAISSSTLVDTKGYLDGIVAAAKETSMEAKAKFTGNVEDIKLGYAQYAAHGDKAFADVVVAMLGDKIVAANIDEFQFLAKDGNTGVPNSDADFGANYADGVVLASKKVNNDSYSNNMKEKAQATKSLKDSYAAIEEFVVGKTAAEVEAVEGEAGTPVDAVSSSTLVDTKGYLDAIALAAKNVGK